jgi:hypothetical protein
MSDTTIGNEELARLAIGGRALHRRRLSRRQLARMLGARHEAEEDDEGEEAFGEEEEGAGEEHRLARLLVGSRMLRRPRLRRLLVAHLLRERSEADDEGEEGEEYEGEEGVEKERKLARLLIGSRILRRSRVRRALLAHLVRERAEADDDDDEGEEYEGEEGGREHKLARALVASRILRHRRVRRALLAHLARERAEADDDDDEGEEYEGEEGGREHKLARALVASRILRHRRVRRALLAHLARERAGAEDDDDEGEDYEGEESGDHEHKLARLLVGGRIARRHRARRALIAHLVRERNEADDDDEGDEYAGENSGEESSDGKLARLLIGSRVLKRRRVRRALAAHLLREREEADA